MYTLFLLFLSSGLFSLNLAVDTQQLQQQCECDGVSPVVGTSVPVFTAFDEKCKLDPSKVPAIASLMKNAGINGVTLLAPQSGALYLTLAEKKQIIRTWCDQKKSTGFPYTVICQVGENDYNETLELAAYAKRSCCDIVMAGPPLFYPPVDVAGLVDYLEGIANACNPTPFMYADLIFEESSYDYNTVKLFARCVKRIDNFIGVKSDLDTCLEVKATNDVSRKILISEASANIPGAYAHCLNGSSTLIANILPKCVVDIQQLSLQGDFFAATSIQYKLNRLYYRAMDVVNKPDRINRSQLGCIIQVGRLLFKIVTGIDLGVLPSPPFPKLTRETVLNVYKVAQEEGFATRYPYDDNYKNQYPSGNKNRGKQTYPVNNNDNNNNNNDNNNDNYD